MSKSYVATIEDVLRYFFDTNDDMPSREKVEFFKKYLWLRGFQIVRISKDQDTEDYNEIQQHERLF